MYTGWYVVFCVWLLSLSMFARTLCIVTCDYEALAPACFMLYVWTVTVTFCLFAMSCKYSVSTCYTFSKPRYTFLYGLIVFKWGNWVGRCAYVCLGLEETGAICLLWLVTGQREHSTCRDLETSWSCFEFGAFCLIRNNCIAWGTLAMCFLLSYAAWDGFSFPTQPFSIYG